MITRHSRIEIGELIYYISAMGKNDQKIFMDDFDRLYLINLLRQQKIKSNLKFYCYVLLPKQYSFLIEIYTNDLSKSMHRINSNYANYFNRRHNKKNKLFKDHYSRFIIEKKNYLEDLSYYLHLLPKSAGVAKSLFKYKWSSLPGYINKEKREEWMDYDSILGIFNDVSHEASLCYQKFIKKRLKKQISSPFKNLRGSIILGSKDFKKEVFKNQSLVKTTHQRDEDVLVKKIIELATQCASWPSLKVKKQKFNHTILSRNAAIYFLKRYTDLSNQQISTSFKSLKKSSISQMSRRFNLIKERYNSIKKISDFLEEEVKKLL